MEKLLQLEADVRMKTTLCEESIQHFNRYLFLDNGADADTPQMKELVKSLSSRLSLYEKSGHF